MATIKLPTYKPPVTPAERPTADRINRNAPREQKLTVAGYNEIVPIVYGKAEVSGPILAGPVAYQGSAYWAVAISHGQIESFDKIHIGDNVVDVGGGNQTVTGDKYSYEFNFYDGTQTAADQNLSDAIEFFNDTFEGVAYVSIKASGDNMNINSGVAFSVSGKRVLDPRDGLVKFTENPALHLHDFVTDGYYGIGRGMVGIGALADHCDSIFGGAPLCRTGHVINTAMGEESAIDMLCMYAEGLWGYKGDDIYVIPDAAVNPDTIVDIPLNQIQDDSVMVFTESATDAPLSIALTFNADNEDGLAGAPVFVTRTESTASTPFMNSSITMMGVFRRTEAQRRAEQRLARLQISGKVSFQLFDVGAGLEVGDVVRFPDYYGLNGVELRVMAQPQMVTQGLFQIETEIYDPSIYNTSDELGAIILPKGAVTLWMSNQPIPKGLTVITPAQDMPLRGSNDITEISEVASYSPEMPLNDTAAIGMAGDHGAKNVTDINLFFHDYFTNPPAPTGVRPPIDSGNHNHGGDLTIELDATDIPVFADGGMSAPLVVCDDDMPIKYGMGFFHRDSITNPSVADQRSVTGLVAASRSKRQDIIKPSDTITIKTEQDGLHSHGNSSMRASSRGTGAYMYDLYGDDRQSIHSHDVIVSFALQIPSVRMHLLATTISDGSIPLGGVVGFMGDVMPNGWSLCDGSMGTVDLTDRFIVIGIDGYDGAGDVNISISGTESGGRHSHLIRGRELYSYKYYPDVTVPANHPEDDGLHSHEITYNRTVPFMPRHIRIAFIQYTG